MSAKHPNVIEKLRFDALFLSINIIQTISTGRDDMIVHVLGSLSISNRTATNHQQMRRFSFRFE